MCHANEQKRQRQRINWMSFKNGRKKNDKIFFHLLQKSSTFFSGHLNCDTVTGPVVEATSINLENIKDKWS